MELDKVKATNYYQDNGDKIKLNWLMYEYANLLYMKISASSKLSNYRKHYSQEQITAFCIYFSKRLKKSLYDAQTGRTKNVEFNGRYVYEFYADNTYAKTQELLEVALAAWSEQLQCCAVCPNKCLMEGYEITDMFDNLEKKGWPT